MNRICNLSKIFNECDFFVERKLIGVNTYNGFYSLKSYFHHLRNMVNNFKHDMYFQMAYEKDVQKEVLLKNIFNELKGKQSYLSNQYNSTQNKICNSKSIIKRINQYLIDKKHCKRIKYMYLKQISCIDKMINIVEVSAENFGINIGSEINISSNEHIIKWDGTPLEFIQNIYAQIYSKRIVLDQTISEKQNIIELARKYGLKLTDKNFSSLSHSIHGNNIDYKPSIFSDLPNAYRKFEDIRREKREHKYY